MCRCAPSLKQALDDATRKWPQRSRLSDGCCGDQAHALRKSDHNADASGYAHAADLTHDPDGGPDCNLLIAPLLLDLRVKYLIFNGKIYYPFSAPKPYTGPNAHRHHLHISIKPNSHLDLAPWPWSPAAVASSQQPAASARTASSEQPIVLPTTDYRLPTTDEPGEPQAPPPVPATTSVSVEDGNVEVKTSQGPKVIELVAIEKPPVKGFATEIRKKISAAAGANISVALLRDWLGEARLFGLSVRFWSWFMLIAGCASLIYLIAAFYKHRSDTARDLTITNQLIAANSTADNRVELVAPEEFEAFQKKGFKIVRR